MSNSPHRDGNASSTMILESSDSTPSSIWTDCRDKKPSRPTSPDKRPATRRNSNAAHSDPAPQDNCQKRIHGHGRANNRRYKKSSWRSPDRKKIRGAACKEATFLKSCLRLLRSGACGLERGISFRPRTEKRRKKWRLKRTRENSAGKNSRSAGTRRRAAGQ